MIVADSQAGEPASSGPRHLPDTGFEGQVRAAILTLLLFAGLGAAAPAASQTIQLEQPLSADQGLLADPMSRLAEEVLKHYRDQDPRAELDNRFRLQLVAGRFDDAGKSLASLSALPPPHVSPALARALNVQYQILAGAGVRARRGEAFETAFARAFEQRMESLDNRTSALVIRALTPLALPQMEQKLSASLDRIKGRKEITLTEALDVLRGYQAAQAYRQFSLLVPPLVKKDDARRYIIEEDVAVRIPSGATICTLVVRPRSAQRRLPALLHFTIYAEPAPLLSEARRTASNGYIGVIGLARGKGCSPDKPEIYKHDGADAAALIDWIAKQSWSDGRVGMYGGSYAGFTTWAAAKHRPKALKAIMPGAAAGPGLDVPKEGNVYWNFVYPWTFYTTNLKYLDDPTYNDRERWARLDRQYYLSGTAYRDLPKLDKAPNPHWSEWVAHSSFDSYWQRMIPVGEDFRGIDIPVLQTAGYFFGGPGAAVYYFNEHYKHRPAAEHYLVVGPYDHLPGHRGTINAFGEAIPSIVGFPLDPVAQIDFGDLRYQWFDHILKGAPRPARLQDKVNYQVTGANIWKHAPSLDAMGPGKLKLHLASARAGDLHRFAPEGSAEQSVRQVINLADRSDIDRVAPGGSLSDKAIDAWNGIQFVSDPLPSTMELSGLFSGSLSFMTNKRDFDFQIQLYEVTPKGDYIQLAPYWSRASHVNDLDRRRLLTPGKRHKFSFKSMRLMSRQLQAGSRVIAVLSIIKEPGRQINYGSGKEVSEETIADAGQPLEIRWFGDSFIELPVGR